MIVGFHEERDRNAVLRSDTRNTNFKDVEIGPDQTKKQKQEEMDMKAEAVKRNREMPSEDRSKNLAWLVVGPRGDKRLIKR
jgi:N-acetylneuraminic acid mutarotase